MRRSFPRRAARDSSSSGFHGFELSDGTTTIRILEDPALGPLVRLDVQDPMKSRLVDRRACSRWTLVLDPNVIVSPGVHMLDGSIDLACRIGEDETIEGKIEFVNCR